MPEKVKELSKPSRTSRFFFRLPILFYRAGLGWVLGKRFLLLTHRGRKTGKERQTVIEVVRYDPVRRVYYVASGWGEKSDWYQNILAHPQVTIQSGRERVAALARRVDSEEAGRELVTYSHRHPAAWRELASFMGYRLNDTEEDVRALGKLLPVIAFEPAAW